MLINREVRENLDSFFRTIKLHNTAKPDTVCKIEQILAYLEMVHAAVRRYSKNRPLVLVDCCAGNCYLGFLIYYYYTEFDPRPVTIHCVDTNGSLMNNARSLAEDLGFGGMEFHACDIMEFSAGDTPHVVYSLHACGSATDKTLFCGIVHGARSILSVSCCQHDIQEHLRNPRYRGITRHRVFKNRLAYMAGDALRALLLEMNGYNADIIEFVSSRYTDKNIMLRAFRGNSPSPDTLSEEYRKIRDEFRVIPELESYLRAMGNGSRHSGPRCIQPGDDSG